MNQAEVINDRIGEVINAFSMPEVEYIEKLAAKFRVEPTFTGYSVHSNFNRIFLDHPEKQLAKWYLQYCMYETL